MLVDYLGIVLFAFSVRFWASALMAAGEVGIWRKSDLAAASFSNSAIAFWLKWFALWTDGVTCVRKRSKIRTEFISDRSSTRDAAVAAKGGCVCSVPVCA